MRIHLIAVGQRMASWVDQGYREFARRMPPECSLQLIEIPALRRGRNADIARLLGREGERMLAAVPRGARVIALDARGRLWSTEQLAGELERWGRDGRDVALLVGGADGLAPACLARADLSWSLSPLTLPHALVRVVLAEQIYRAWTIIRGHPYHHGH
jgi:23S rRNA (pseudouridine1915-N3)-methyltransferase